MRKPTLCYNLLNECWVRGSWPLVVPYTGQFGCWHSSSQTLHPGQPLAVIATCDLMQFSGSLRHVLTGHAKLHTGQPSHPSSPTDGKGSLQKMAGQTSSGHSGFSNFTQTLQLGQPWRCLVDFHFIQLSGSFWHFLQGGLLLRTNYKKTDKG